MAERVLGRTLCTETWTGTQREAGVQEGKPWRDVVTLDVTPGASSKFPDGISVVPVVETAVSVGAAQGCGIANAAGWVSMTVVAVERGTLEDEEVPRLVAEGFPCFVKQGGAEMDFVHPVFLSEGGKCQRSAGERREVVAAGTCQRIRLVGTDLPWAGREEQWMAVVVFSIEGVVDAELSIRASMNDGAPLSAK